MKVKLINELCPDNVRKIKSIRKILSNLENIWDSSFKIDCEQSFNPIRFKNSEEVRELSFLLEESNLDDLCENLQKELDYLIRESLEIYIDKNNLRAVNYDDYGAKYNGSYLKMVVSISQHIFGENISYKIVGDKQVLVTPWSMMTSGHSKKRKAKFALHLLFIKYNYN